MIVDWLKHLLIILFFCTIADADAQRTWTMHTSAEGSDYERFQVLTDQPTVRDGAYSATVNEIQRTKGYYTKGLRTGFWEYGLPDGALYFKGNFVDEKRDGRWSYTADETTLSNIYYRKGVVDRVRTMNNDGTTNYVHRLDSLGNGMSQGFYPDGPLRAEGEVKNYRLDCIYSEYFENGQLHRRMIYLDDRPITVLETYNLHGDIVSGSDLAQGTGKYICYNLVNEGDGLILSDVTNYRDSLKHGPYEKYYDGREISGRYELDEKVGFELTISENGLKRDSIFCKPAEQTEIPKDPVNYGK